MGAVQRLATAIGLADQPSARAVFLHRDDKQLFNLARCLDTIAAHHPLPLAGKIVVIKGNIDLHGLPTTAASKTFEAPEAKTNAPLVRQLLDAGALPMGHANMSEFAFSGLGLNPHFDSPLNALDRELVPGGSSSGCATAIALGIADMAVGTDTSGSTRVPAAYQGIVGFRPSIGRYDGGGILPLAPSLDTPGPMARNMTHLRALDEVLSNIPTPRISPPLPKFVLPNFEGLGTIDPAIIQTMETAIRALEDAGIAIQRRHITALTAVRDLFAKHGTLVAVEAGRALNPFATHDNEKLDPNVRLRLNAARQISSKDAEIIVSMRAGLQEQLALELGEDLLLIPTVPALPPRVDHVVSDDKAFAHHNARALSLTMLGAYLDMPSLALPAGCAIPGHSITIAATSGTDKHVLNAGHQLERFLLHSQPESLICPLPIPSLSI